MSGEFCQWVLDAVRETVEWQSATRVQLPHSPQYTRQILKSLDNDRAGTIIKVADGVQYFQPRMTTGAFVFLGTTGIFICSLPAPSPIRSAWQSHSRSRL